VSETTSTYPYTLDVEPNLRAKDTWQWAIRKHGKLIQRSDRDHPSAVKARSEGMAEITKLLSGGDWGIF